jgi:hypothetical protein
MHGSPEYLAAVKQEFLKADETLMDLVGETVDTLTVNSLEPEDAPFLGLVVSKLSPMIGNLLERRITQVLSESSADGFHWLRQDPGFPDAILVDELGKLTGAGYEVKAWYALSTELTGRFRESINLLAEKNIKVVVIAWAMSHVVYGTPEILGIVSVDASEVASSRDSHYFKPPQYLTVEPGDTSSRTKNLQQSNVSGYRMQVDDEVEISLAQALTDNHAGKGKDSSSIEAQELVKELMNKFDYRLDTNFAKIDRIDNVAIESFKSDILAMQFRGRSIKEWTKVLKNLNSDKESDEFIEAATLIKNVYKNL